MTTEAHIVRISTTTIVQPPAIGLTRIAVDRAVNQTALQCFDRVPAVTMAIPRRVRAAFVIALSSLAASACASSSAVTLELDLPPTAPLRPTDMTTIDIEADIPGQAPVLSTSTIEFDNNGVGSFTSGELAPGTSAAISLELKSSADRLVGYGATDGLVDIVDGKTTAIAIPVRRPLAYVASDIGVSTYDATRDAIDSDYQGTLTAHTATLAVSIDNARVAVIGNSALQLFETAKHTAVGDPISIPATVHDAAQVPGGRVAIAGTKGVTIVDVDAGTTTLVTTSDSVSRVTATTRVSDQHTLVFALLNRILPSTSTTTCSGSSQVVVIDLDADANATTLANSLPLSDIAADGSLFGVDPCAGNIVAVGGDGGPAAGTMLASVSRPTQVVAINGRVWAAGNVAAIIINADPNPINDQILGAAISLVNVAEDGTDVQTFSLPTNSQVVVNTNDPAHELSNIIQADDLAVIDLSVAPDGRFATVLTEGTFTTAELDDQNSVALVPAMSVTVDSVVVIDGASESISELTRARCDLDVMADPNNPPVFDMWDCSANGVDQAPANGEFTPTSVSVLYGAH